jgi:thioredoxin 1
VGKDKNMIIRILFGVLVGGVLGAVLGYWGKCSSGTCPLTANPYRGAIYGAVLGALLTPILWPKSQESPSTSNTVDLNSKSDLNAKVLDAAEISVVESLTKDSFLEKVFNYQQHKEWRFEGKLPCIIDFYADWCGPCKMVEPILKELAQEYQGKLNIYRVDTQAQQELAAVFGIQSIPSILFVPLNDKPQMAVGALPKRTLKKAIKEVLKVE